jgi:4,5-dihydroxyphthalate decarboxylase
MTNGSPVRLKTAIATLGNHAALKDGSIKPDGIEFEFIEGNTIENYRRMAHGREFDVCQLSFVTYLMSHFQRGFTAIPVVPARRVHHGDVYYNANVLNSPKDLEGKKFALRAYTVTPGTWGRGFILNDYGIDPAKVTWVVNREEHIDEYQAPPNVVHDMEADLATPFSRGEIAAGHAPALGEAIREPHVKRFYPDPAAAQREYFDRTGVLPFDDVIAIKGQVVADNPWVAPALFEAFKAAKEQYLRATPNPDIPGATYLQGDPLPFGIEPNRKAMEMCMQYALQQGSIPRALPLEELFTANTRALT